MLSATEEIKALPVEDRRKAIMDILESFPEDDPIFDFVEEGYEETVSDELKQLLEEREKQMASGEFKWHSREGMDHFLLKKKVK